MSTEVKDLWPPTFAPLGDPTPVTILRQQGYLLGRKTQNLVYGEVRSRKRAVGEFEHTLSVTAATLGYSQPIVTVTHGVDPYPAVLSKPSYTGGPDRFAVQPSSTATTPEEFVSELEKYLTSEGTVLLIRSLVTQCQDFDAEPAD
jgi:hypothetical protein